MDTSIIFSLQPRKFSCNPNLERSQAVDRDAAILGAHSLETVAEETCTSGPTIEKLGNVT